MIIGVLKEPSGESRVSLLPEMAKALITAGHQVLVEQNAGVHAFAGNKAYVDAGAQLVERDELWKSDCLLSIQLPELLPLSLLKQKVLIGVFQPLYHKAVMDGWAAAGITSFSLDMLPRTSRAQSMDVLSSQANIAGYKAVLLAASLYARYFPMFMTAAGSIAPAKVLVLGAGVAGLQAVATARRLGAVVEVFDTRAAVKEEVKSLGAKFIEVEGAADATNAGGYAVEQSEAFKEAQKAKIAASIAKADIVITTAQIPGKKAPVLVTEEMIAAMRPGSVIVDLAAATGGNTSVTRNNDTIVVHDVSIVGNSQLASTVPSDASKLYGKNIQQFLVLITDKDGKLNLNWEDDLVKGACITHDHDIKNERVKMIEHTKTN